MLTTVLLLAAGMAAAQPAGFTLAASPASRQICDAAHVTYLVSVDGFGGFSEPVTLGTDGLPTGATAGFSVNPVAPGGSSTLTVGNLGATLGEFAIAITGIAATADDETSAELQVYDEFDCDFVLSVTPSDPAACAVDEIEYAVSVTPQFGTTVPVTLGAEGAPAGATIGFAPNPVHPPGIGTLTVGNLSGAAPGSYALLVTGIHPNRTREAGARLVVPPVWRNETGETEECDACTLVSPATISLALGETTPAILGSVYEPGLTEGAGPNPAIRAELGLGPAGSDPRSDCRWRWVPAAFESDVGDADLYAAIVQPLTTGEQAYAFRFSFDDGASATAADLDGAGSSPGLAFSPHELGVLHVPEPTGAGWVAAAVLLRRASRRRRDPSRTHH